MTRETSERSTRREDEQEEDIDALVASHASSTFSHNPSRASNYSQTSQSSQRSTNLLSPFSVSTPHASLSHLVYSSTQLNHAMHAGTFQMLHLMKNNKIIQVWSSPLIHPFSSTPPIFD